MRPFPGGATGPDGAWSPEIPFPETGSDLSGLTGESQICVNAKIAQLTCQEQ
jgi:hypothetical protein